ncbi:glycosyltransferase family 4 protein [Cohnella sp. GCM10020058]|uniref:glycosyltransferase family 4 protein n=1 Tax=Cohnella sp. GCM10020058 TaxID=3317330 RepID=UPI003641A4E2
MIANKSLKLAVVAFELPALTERTGGVSHFNHRLCNMLAERGHDVTALTVRQPLPEARYRVVQVPGAQAGKGRFHRYYQAPWRAKSIDFSEFDLVLANGDDWAMRHAGTPWFRIMHGSARRELKFNKRWLRKINLAALYGLELIAAARSDVTLFNSADSRKLYFHRKKDRIVHLPVDTRVYYPGTKADRPTLLFVGALDSRKRGRWLLNLFVSKIKPALPNAQLWMVCDPVQPEDGVEYVQMPSQEQLASLYRQSHVFCMPSTYEGFGIPYLEAMASGTHVVTTANPGAEEVLGDGCYGQIVKDAELADTLIRALKSGADQTGELERWTIPALEWARLHDWEILLDEFVGLADDKRESNHALHKVRS